MKYFKDIKYYNFYAIYLIGLSIYAIIVIFIINSYYLSGEKFSEFYCFCIKPSPPTLPTINYPSISISIKEIKVYPRSTCNICLNKTSKTIQLSCQCPHILCQTCLNGIQQHDNHGNQLCPWCRKAIIAS